MGLGGKAQDWNGSWRQWRASKSTWAGNWHAFTSSSLWDENRLEGETIEIEQLEAWSHSCLVAVEKQTWTMPFYPEWKSFVQPTNCSLFSWFYLFFFFFRMLAHSVGRWDQSPNLAKYAVSHPEDFTDLLPHSLYLGFLRFAATATVQCVTRR